MHDKIKLPGACQQLIRRTTDHKTLVSLMLDAPDTVIILGHLCYGVFLEKSLKELVPEVERYAVGSSLGLDSGFDAGTFFNSEFEVRHVTTP